MLYKYIMPPKARATKAQVAEVNLNVKAVKKLRPQLINYLDRVSSKINGKSYSTIKNVFMNSNKKKLIKTYEDLKMQVEQYTPDSQKISMRTIRPLPQKDYQLNVLFYTDKPFKEGKKGEQKKWQELYVMFPKDPVRELQVKAPKVFPVHLIKRVIRSDKKKEQRLFKVALQIFLTDDKFKELYDKTRSADIVAFKIVKVDYVDASKSKHKPLEADLKDSQKISINNKYMETRLDTTFKTFKEAIAKTPYVINECWLNTLGEVYGNSLMSNNKRELVNREKILQILGKTEENIKKGISVNAVLPFFQKYRLPLRVFDEYMRPIFRYDPENRNHNYHALYCLIKGNHVYTLNNNLKELQQKDVNETMFLKASENYYIPDKAVIPSFKMIDGIDDIVRIIEGLEGKENATELHLIHKRNNMTELVYDLKDAGYEPSIKYEAGHVTRLEMTLSKTIKLRIESQQLVKDSMDGDISVDTEEIYNNMNKAMARFNHTLIKPEYKSYYSKTDIDILDEYRTTVPIGMLSSFLDIDNVVEIDISKAFTAAFLKITKVPVFNEFDSFRIYDNRSIKDYCLYVIRTSKTSLFLSKTHNIVYGMFLNQFADEFEILAYKEPSFLKPINTKAMIEALWKEELSPDHEEDKALKKLIANVNFGLLEKSTNKVQKSKMYDTLDEAKYYQERIGGKISVLSKFTEDFEIDDHDVGTDNPHMESVWKEHDQKYYVLNVSDKACLKNGFRYLKELLLQHHNFKMYTDYTTLRNHGIEVFSVKSDALTIGKDMLEKARGIIEFSNDIGGWRLSKTEGIKFPMEKLKRHHNIEIKIEAPTFYKIEVQNEYDTDELCEIFEKYRRVIVRADLPGSGKSFACEKMKQRGHKVLFVCPYQKLSQKYGCDGVTLNKFFSMGVDTEALKTKFDSSDYDVVVFDEIYLACIKKLTRIKGYCEAHPEQIIIATGDTSQLEPIDQLTNQLNYDEYADHCVNTIFNHEVYLRIPKRVKSNEDKTKLKQLKEDIFNTEIPIMDTITKYFKFTTDQTQCTKNIAYLNKTCASVAQEIRKKMNRTAEYEVGEKIVCRKWFKVAKDSFNKNFEYEVMDVHGDAITIKDATNKTYVLDIGKIRTHFIYNYCVTCHSFQGSSIEEPMTIFGYKFCFVDRKWIWTAITRATDLNNVWFHEYTEKPFNKKVVEAYFRRKIEGYKAQDKKANRTISENYVTVGWLMKCINKNCHECKCKLEMDFDDSNVPSSTITAQRLDNHKDHNLDNIVPMCEICNVSLSNKF